MLEPKLLKLIENFFKLLFGLGMAIVVVVIIILGIQYIVGGKTEVVRKVHEKWKYILIALFLIIFSLTIPKLISSFFNLDIKILH